jgi:hypothetical protein
MAPPSSYRRHVGERHQHEHQQFSEFLHQPFLSRVRLRCEGMPEATASAVPLPLA